MGDEDFIRKSLLLIGGLLVWALHFGVVYSFNALACARGFVGVKVFDLGIVPVFIVGATVLALVAGGAIFTVAYRRGSRIGSLDDRPVDDFMRYGTMILAALALVAIAWNGIPAFVVPPCG